MGDLEDIRVALAALRPSDPPLLKLASASAAAFYSSLTLKQMALRALKEHFTEGASAQQLLEYFETAYGRSIERSSLSPQLSRLKEDHEIELEGRLWKLVSPKQKEPPAKADGSIVEDGGVAPPRPSPVLLSRP